MSKQMSKRLRNTLKDSKFSQVPIVAVAAKPGGGDENNAVPDNKNDAQEPIGLRLLLETLSNQSAFPQRKSDGPFILSVDHCFSIKGQGTIMTGTIIQGSVAINDVSIFYETFYLIDN